MSLQVAAPGATAASLFDGTTTQPRATRMPLSSRCRLAGGIAAMPLLARILLTPLQSFGRVSASADLALKRLWGAPSQAAIALGGIVASTSLMIAMAVMVWSFRGSVDSWLVQVLPADIYLRLDGDSSLDADLRGKLLAAPGVESINFRKMVPLRLNAERPAVVLVAQTIDRENPVATLPLIGASHGPPRAHAGLGAGTGSALTLSGGRRLNCPRRPCGQPATFFCFRNLARIWRSRGDFHDTQLYLDHRG